MATYPRAKKPAIFAKKLGLLFKAKEPVVVHAHAVRLRTKARDVGCCREIGARSAVRPGGRGEGQSLPYARGDGARDRDTRP